MEAKRAATMATQEWEAKHERWIETCRSLREAERRWRDVCGMDRQAEKEARRKLREAQKAERQAREEAWSGIVDC